jgi:hypothetical protein
MSQDDVVNELLNTGTKWTQFWDMHSGGGLKEAPYSQIYIEAPEDEAALIFYNRFGHNPYRVSCTCCGEDYSLDTKDTLAEVSAYQRGCRYAYFDADGKEIKGKGKNKAVKHGYIEEKDPNAFSDNKFMSVEEYEKRKDVLVIRKEEISPEERRGDLPREGYVWH